MKRLLSLAFLLLWTFPACAQVPMTGAGLGKPASGGGATCASVLPNLVLNLDASVSASVHLSGSNVTQWDDRSSNGNNFVQATGARQPTYSATGFNTAHPGITTVAANAQFLQNTTFPLNTATMSIFIVHTFTASDPLNNGFASFVASGQSDDFGNNPSFIFSAPPFTGGSYRFVSNAYNDSQLSASTQNSPTTTGWVFDGVNGTGYLDFSADTPVSRTATFGGTTGLMALGSRPWNGNTPSFDGTYAEIIMTSSAISGATLTTLHSCLSAKWGVP